MLRKVLISFLAVAMVAAMSTIVFAKVPIGLGADFTDTTATATKSVIPVETTDISKSKRNNYIAFNTDSNEPVYAVKNGTVAFYDYNKSAGYEIRIEHEDGFTSKYFHLDKTYFRNNKMEIGDVVSAGDIVGETGDSGATRGNKCGFALAQTANLEKNVFEEIKQINEYLGIK